LEFGALDFEFIHKSSSKCVLGYNSRMRIIQYQLKNGLNVFFVPQKDATSVSVELMVKAGSKDEVKGTEGLAHFLEHMTFKGSKKWPTPRKLAEVLDGMGSYYNAYTSKELTNYLIKVAPPYLETALEVISDYLNYALLPVAEINRERGVIIEEINMYKDQPDAHVWHFFEEMIVGKNALGRPLSGKKETVLKIKRQDFVDFKEKWYLADRMSLAIVGAIGNEKETKDKIKRLFGNFLTGKAKDILPKQEPVIGMDWHTQKTNQTHFLLGIPTVPLDDKREWAGNLLSTILGSGFSSRLWMEFRAKRGWAYYVFASHDQYQSAGYLAIGAGVKNEIIGEAIEAVRDELTKIKKDLKKSEFERARRARTGRFMIRLENTSELAGMINANWLLEKKVYTPEDVVREYEKLKFGEVAEFAREFLNTDKISGAAIGPSSKNSSK